MLRLPSLLPLQWQALDKLDAVASYASARKGDGRMQTITGTVTPSTAFPEILTMRTIGESDMRGYLQQKRIGRTAILIGYHKGLRFSEGGPPAVVGLRRSPGP